MGCCVWLRGWLVGRLVGWKEGRIDHQSVSLSNVDLPARRAGLVGGVGCAIGSIICTVPTVILGVKYRVPGLERKNFHVSGSRILCSVRGLVIINQWAVSTWVGIYVPHSYYMEMKKQRKKKQTDRQTDRQTVGNKNTITPNQTKPTPKCCRVCTYNISSLPRNRP